MQAAPSCYSSMVASTSDESQSSPTNMTISNLNTSTTNKQFIEAPAFFYDMDSDLKELKTALKGADLLNDSGYRSVMERSHHPFATSIILNENDGFDSEDDASDEHWDGYLTVGADRIKIKDMSDILATRYAFISGSRNKDGFTVVTFPDSRSTLPFEDYSLLIKYLLQVPPLEESHKGFVIIIDRRSDKWSSVRTLLIQISSFFPGQVRVIYIIKPEGVLQRALEVGYRGIADSCSFEVIQLESSAELRAYFRCDQLTMDVGGLIKYNHLEWVQHRMDIERMKASATAIAASLTDFGKTLRETELPNDVESTARILDLQTAEKDAIKEEFKISVRKGVSLLKSVRQLDKKPTPEQLSPTRLHNVTAIERMLVQLEETERSFDSFWTKHEKRLSNCLKLRQFEECFRKLQAAFARHMLYLEEHREVGNCAEKAIQLAEQHRQYAETAMEEVIASRELKNTGEELISSNEAELCGSLLPKCEELERMAEALTGALERRTVVLTMSADMHEQITQVTNWCSRGADMITAGMADFTRDTPASSLSTWDNFLSEGQDLKIDLLKDTASSDKKLILLTTTETSTLLKLVEERMNDMRKMAIAKREQVHKCQEHKKLPIQVVTPEKKKKTGASKIEPTIDAKEIQCCSGESTPSGESSPRRESKEIHVLDELLTTEMNYVADLKSIVTNYIQPFEAFEFQSSIPAGIRGKSETMFGNLRDLYTFHAHVILEDFKAATTSKGVCKVLMQHRNKFFTLYRTYCQFKAAHEQTRKDCIENSPFFKNCQKNAAHQLPLDSYLLKPVQRITKYQLLLDSLAKECQPELREEIRAATACMRDLLNQLNAAMQQLHISGFNGDLRVLGPLRLQSECDVFTYNRKKKNKLSRAQRRFLFLFDGGVMFCKKRTPPSNQPSSMDPEYFEHKLCIPSVSLGFTDTSRSGANRFEIWDEAKVDGQVIELIDQGARCRWLERLGKTLIPQDGYIIENRQRPKSWASTVSNESSCSSSTRESDSGDSHMDTNGNTQTTGIASQYSPVLDQQLEISMDTTPSQPLNEMSSEVELVDSC